MGVFPLLQMSCASWCCLEGAFLELGLELLLWLLSGQATPEQEAITYLGCASSSPKATDALGKILDEKV